MNRGKGEGGRGGGGGGDVYAAVTLRIHRAMDLLQARGQPPARRTWARTCTHYTHACTHGRAIHTYSHVHIQIQIHFHTHADAGKYMHVHTHAKKCDEFGRCPCHTTHRVETEPWHPRDSAIRLEARLVHNAHTNRCEQHGCHGVLASRIHGIPQEIPCPIRIHGSESTCVCARMRARRVAWGCGVCGTRSRRIR